MWQAVPSPDFPFFLLRPSFLPNLSEKMPVLATWGNCSSAVFLTTGKSSSTLLVAWAKTLNAPFSHIPHATHQKILSAPPSKYIQNQTTFHHLHYHQPARPGCHLLPGFLQEPPIWSPHTALYVPLWSILNTAAKEMMLKHKSDLITLLLKPLQWLIISLSKVKTWPLRCGPPLLLWRQLPFFSLSYRSRHKTSLLFSEHARWVFASGPLHWLWYLPGMFFSQIFK